MEVEKRFIKYKKSTRAPSLGIGNKILPNSKRSTRIHAENYIRKIVQHKRSQSAVEFAIVLGVALFFFVVFFTIIHSTQAEKNRDKERYAAHDVALRVQKEISFAAESTDGYSREFKTPLNILGKEYDIEVNATTNVVKVSLENIKAIYDIQPVTGQINKGTNTIRKEDGTIYLNQ